MDHYQARRLAEAQMLCHQILASEPLDLQALNLLGVAACEAGNMAEGTACFRRMIEIAPGLPGAHRNLGNALRAQNRFAEAAESYREALARQPDDAEVHENLAKTLSAQGDFAEAAVHFARLCALLPDQARAQDSLGAALREQGKPVAAEASYRRALALEPKRAAFHNNLGTVLQDQGRLEEAIDSYRRAVELDPSHYNAHLNLGLALRLRGRSVEAIASFRRALAVKPNLAAAYNGQAQILRAQGRAADAAFYYRRAMETAPDAHHHHTRLSSLGARDYHSNLLYCMQYDPATAPGALLLAHRAYEASLNPAPPAEHTNSRDSERRLNIGYVSPDLHQHPVGFLMMPVLAAHDRARFGIHCYYGSMEEDGITAFLKSRAEVWRSTVGVGDDALETMIRADGIDILVDLAGHTAKNRLPVFARRPAPVQVTWAGYEGTTGLSQIDYLITDRWLSPPGSERYAVEQLVRLPDGYVCWAIPADAPDIGRLAAAAPGAVTFGCFNNLAKVNPLVIALWAQLLRELPQSRLLLKSRELGDAAMRDGLVSLFAAEGIDAERLLLEGQSPHAEYLKRYAEVDIALDPFPFSGGVTTIDTLWMGVPVVTLGGDRFAARHSLSHLNVAGLGELVADSPERYLRIAVELARDLPRLAALRAGMRDRLRASPLLQSRRFMRGLERAYRDMWQKWCQRVG